MVVVDFVLSGEGYGAGGAEGTLGALGTIGTNGTLGTGGALGAGGVLGQGRASETVIVPLDGEFCVYATLEEEETAVDGGGLRGLATIPVDTRVRIVAFQGTTHVADAEYKVTDGSGGIVPVSPPGLTVNSGVTYNFVAYSVSSTTSVPAYAAALVVSPDVDLLWGMEPSVYIGGGESVVIGMAHKFSQVTVRANSGSITPTAAISNVTDVKISPSYNASLNVATGAMGTSGGAFDYGLPSSFSGSSTLVSNAAHTVFTHTASPVSIKIGSVKVGVATYPDRVATFAMSLVAGRKYTLAVDFKRNLVWAGSNIYWVAVSNGLPQAPGYLTFDAPSTASNTNQRKHGVSFKWGSLVGIALSSAGTYVCDVGKFAPEFVSTSNKSWVDGGSAYYNYNDIPYISDNIVDLTNDAYNTANSYAYWKARKGDICRYISENGYGPGGNYRMPTYLEFGAQWSYSKDTYGWTNTGTFGAESIYGSGYGDTIALSWWSNSWGDVTFPATCGYSAGSSGTEASILQTGRGGSYWISNNRGYSVSMSSTTVQHTSSLSLTDPAAVRCVRAN
jgi:hypothetical protein